MNGNFDRTPLDIKWRKKVLSEDGPKNPTTRLILMALHKYMDDRGRCWPKEAALAESTGLSEKSVITHLKIAEEQGWFERRRVRPEGRQWWHYDYQARFPLPKELDDLANIQVKNIHVMADKDGLNMAPDDLNMAPDDLSQVQTNAPSNSPIQRNACKKSDISESLSSPQIETAETDNFTIYASTARIGELKSETAPSMSESDDKEMAFIATLPPYAKRLALEKRERDEKAARKKQIWNHALTLLIPEIKNDQARNFLKQARNRLGESAFCSAVDEAQRAGVKGQDAKAWIEAECRRRKMEATYRETPHALPS